MKKKHQPSRIIQAEATPSRVPALLIGSLALATLSLAVLYRQETQKSSRLEETVAELRIRQSEILQTQSETIRRAQNFPVSSRPCAAPSQGEEAPVKVEHRRVVDATEPSVRQGNAAVAPGIIDSTTAGDDALFAD